MKKVSVVVPCYNAAKYLDKCVGYLLRQTIGLEDMEIILVDDASTDGGETRNCILGYEQRFPDTVIAVFLEQNLRQGGARIFLQNWIRKTKRSGFCLKWETIPIVPKINCSGCLWSGGARLHLWNIYL